MYQLFYTPQWFNGIDLVFDVIILIIALLIANYSWKVFKISSENKYGYFTLAFVLIALGFIFKLITHGVLYYSSLQQIAGSFLQPITQGNVVYNNLFYRAGFFLQMVSMLGGWLLIFFISQKSRQRLKKIYEISQIVLFIYLVVLISVVSNFAYVVFYLTSLVIVSLVVLNYYQNYVNKHNKNLFLVMGSFLLVLISQLFFVFVFIWKELYIFGEVFLLLGFLILLYTYRKITKITY